MLSNAIMSGWMQGGNGEFTSAPDAANPPNPPVQLTEDPQTTRLCILYLPEHRAEGGKVLYRACAMHVAARRAGAMGVAVRRACAMRGQCVRRACAHAKTHTHT